MSDFKAALFDMDGTLFNTKKGIVKALRLAINEYGLRALEESEEDCFIGPPIQKTIEKVYGISEQDSIDCANLFRRYYREKGYVLECDLYDGMTDCLKRLKADGIRLCIASLKKEDMVKRICENYEISDFFDSIHGTDDHDSLSKADIINICLKEVGVEDKEKAVMIGDTSFDAIGAEEAQVAFLGVSYGFGFNDEADVNDFENIGTASSPQEIADILL